MNDKVLSEGEMDALLEDTAGEPSPVLTRTGVEQMLVRSFDISPRAHLKFGSYPELQRLNEKSAQKLQSYFRNTLNWSVSCSLSSQEEMSLQALRDNFSGLQLALRFSLSPFGGDAILIPDLALSCALVEVFFGSTSIPSSPGNPESFSAGQVRVATRFAEKFCQMTADVWAPIAELAFKYEGAEQALERVDLGPPKSPMIASQFQIDGEDFGARFCMVLPLSAIASLSDRLEGAERSQSTSKNAEWSRWLAQHVHRMSLPLVARNVATPLRLSSFDSLEAGQILPIAAPEHISLFCGDTRIADGEFGVHQQRTCIRLAAEPGDSATL